MNRPIDITLLSRGGREFASAKFKVFNDAVRKARGEALCVVHPLFSRPFIESGRLPGPEHRADVFTKEYYAIFLDKFRAFILKKGLPNFVFVDPRKRREIEKWLTGSGVRSPIAVIEAQRTWRGVIGGAEWSWLKGIFEELDIKRFSVIGEQYYSLFNGRMHEGCVDEISQHLSDPFRVKILENYTYPNIDNTSSYNQAFNLID